MSKTKKQKNANKHRALSAQQTIPYIAMHPDGICQIPGGLYTKTLEYEDINYAVASAEDQTAIISGWSACLNYFDSSLPFQLSFVNRRSRNVSRYKVNIPAQEDDFNSIRGEFVEMLKGQIAKSNNGIERYKYITFGLPAEGVAEARPRLGRVEADVMGNLKRLGVQSRPLDGRERLTGLHGQMHPGGREPFRFAWKDIPKTGMGTKDYIAPDSFDFRQSRTFRVGQMWGAASYLQIMASELSDKLLAEILELDAELTVTMHIQTVDQLKAIKTIKGKISDIGRMKAEEQKKAVRAGYDMEILPPDLITFSKDAAELLSDLQSRNERMFLLTFTVVNLAPTRQRLENDVFTVSGIAQKYNCALRRLDWQQEQGFVSSLALGYNGIEIQRGMTTSSTAIFIPFMTRELRMDGQALYYGMNALSNNVIMADRKKLKSANGMYLGSTGSGKSFAAKRELINVFLATNDRIIVVDPMGEYAPLVRRLGGQVIEIAPDSPHHISPTRLRASTLGGGYDPEDIKAVIAGERPIPEQPVPAPAPPRRVNLIVDIQEHLRSGKGAAYARWAKVYNLKQMAAALQFMQEQNITEYNQLSAKAEDAVSRFHALTEQLRRTEADLSATSELMGAVVRYAKTRPVFDGYKAAKYSRKYLAEHEAELADYRAAKATMGELLGGEKLPKMAELKEKRRQLAARKKALYTEYRLAQEEMRQAVAVKANIDHLLGVTGGQRKKEQER